jgi:G3E family GTPase
MSGLICVLCFGAYAIGGDGVVGIIFFEVSMIPNASPDIIQKTYFHIKQLNNGLIQCCTLLEILLFTTSHYVIVYN